MWAIKKKSFQCGIQYKENADRVLKSCQEFSAKLKALKDGMAKSNVGWVKRKRQQEWMKSYDSRGICLWNNFLLAIKFSMRYLHDMNFKKNFFKYGYLKAIFTPGKELHCLRLSSFLWLLMFICIFIPLPDNKWIGKTGDFGKTCME